MERVRGTSDYSYWNQVHAFSSLLFSHLPLPLSLSLTPLSAPIDGATCNSLVRQFALVQFYRRHVRSRFARSFVLSLSLSLARFDDRNKNQKLSSRWQMKKRKPFDCYLSRLVCLLDFFFVVSPLSFSPFPFSLLISLSCSKGLLRVSVSRNREETRSFFLISAFLTLMRDLVHKKRIKSRKAPYYSTTYIRYIRPRQRFSNHMSRKACAFLPSISTLKAS